MVPGVDSLENLRVDTVTSLFLKDPSFSEVGAAGTLPVSRRRSEWIEVEQSGSSQDIATWVV